MTGLGVRVPGGVEGAGSHQKLTHVHGKQPSAKKKAGRGQSCQPPGPKALMVACFFPPVPKSEDLVVIRRHLLGVGLGCAAQIQALEL